MQFERLPGYSADDLVVGGTNRLAVELVSSWPDWPSAVVVLAGPTGAGKTHLASIWKTQSRARSYRARSIGEPQLPSSGAALVEDVDAGSLDEPGLFHLINEVRASSGTLLLTSRSFPGGWGVSLPDLASRLKSATTVEIAEPDDALLTAVIAKLFADRQLTVEPHVVSYLVNRMDRSLATAMKLVEQIDRLSLARQRRVSRTLAADALGQLDQGRDPDAI